MHTVLYTIVIVLIIIYGFKAYQNYPSYKNSILPTLFPNYFEFFWRMFIRKDASNSSYLNKSIGNHKLSFATIETDNTKSLLNLFFFSITKESQSLNIWIILVRILVMTKIVLGSLKVTTKRSASLIRFMSYKHIKIEFKKCLRMDKYHL